MLTDVLEIDFKLLKCEHNAAMDIAERAWAEAGRPTAPADMIEFIEKVLIACRSCGYEYPPILLRRKKEMIRGTWRPRMQAGGITSSSAPPSYTHSKIPEEWIRQSDQNRRNELLVRKAKA